MKIPTVKGVIDRRILLNYRIDPDVMSAILPEPFKPKLVKGFAIGGICLIRLKNIKPKAFCFPCGINSENAAHRIAVEWEQNGEFKEGVFINRRDTDSILNSFAGGRLFPGVHHHAKFDVVENDDDYYVSVKSRDQLTRIKVKGQKTNRLSKKVRFRFS